MSTSVTEQPASLAVVEVVVPIAYNLNDAARAVGRSRETVSRAIRAGELVAHYPTSHPSILHTDLVAWIAKAPTEPKTASAPS